MKAHPAKFNESISDVIRDVLEEEETLLHGMPLVLDPFAGVGGIHKIWFWDYSVGVELEPEWAEQGRNTIVGNALRLPFPKWTFDAIVTSPVFGNRMSDHHNARDGSDRITYKHKLGRDLHPDNAGQLQWGPAYRKLHRKAWREADRVLRPGGLFVINIGDHIRKKKRQRVSKWHHQTMIKMGYTLERRIKVEVRKMRKGENHQARIPYEYVLVYRKEPF